MTRCLLCCKYVLKTINDICRTLYVCMTVRWYTDWHFKRPRRRSSISQLIISSLAWRTEPKHRRTLPRKWCVENDTMTQICQVPFTRRIPHCVGTVSTYHGHGQRWTVQWNWLKEYMRVTWQYVTSWQDWEEQHSATNILWQFGWKAAVDIRIRILSVGLLPEVASGPVKSRFSKWTSSEVFLVKEILGKLRPPRSIIL